MEVIEINPLEGMEINPQLLYPIGGTSSTGFIYKIEISEDSVTQTAVLKFLNEGFDLHEANKIVQKLKSALSDTDSFVIPRGFLRFGGELAMLMPYVNGGSVKSLTSWGFKRGLPEDYVGFLLKNVLHALVYLHSMSLFHGNLKCGNILLSSDGHVKLSGIGFPRYVMDGKVNPGEQYFLAPEVLDLKYSKMGPKCDVWSLGIAGLEMIRGKAPLSHFSKSKAFLRESTTCFEASDLLVNMIESCLVDDARKRCTAEQLLEHPFFQKDFGSGLRMMEGVPFVEDRRVSEDELRLKNGDDITGWRFNAKWLHMEPILKVRRRKV